jgi:5'-nucleotidase
MTENKQLILLVNDDGILSPGLKALAEALSDLGEVLIVAPNEQQTSMGRAYPIGERLGVIEKMPEELFGQGIEAYSVIASPAYCVAYAVMEIAHRKPDLCISGINYGENLGKTLSYSGTVGAALQAADFGIPSIAMSRPTKLSEINGDYADLDWTYAKSVIRFWAKKVIEEGMPKGAPILNINVPEFSSEPDVFKYTVQSKEDMFLFEKSEKRDFSKPFKLHSKKRDDFKDVERNSDIWAVCVEALTSVTPIACDYTLKN